MNTPNNDSKNLDSKCKISIPYRFGVDIGKAIITSNDAECLAKNFDIIYLKLLRLIKYSINKNKVERLRLLEDFFRYIVDFIEQFNKLDDMGEVHNNFPKTSIQEYSKKTFGNQLFQIFYKRKWGINGISEGGNCSYWTVLLYNFFNKLKEVGLDLKISIFRYKNFDDEILGNPSNRHSGLIINFQGKYFIVDYNRGPIIKQLELYIDMAKNGKDSKDIEFFENFKDRKETDRVIFFDNLNDFINHCEKNGPKYYRIAFYAKNPKNDRVELIKYEFTNRYFSVGDSEYYLLDNDLSKNELIENLINKVITKRTGDKTETITEKDREHLREYFDLIKDKVNLLKLYENFTSQCR